MTHEELQDLLGAYALDAVDPDEVVELERHLLECARCRAEVEEHREVAGLLAHSGTDAPDGLWERIAGSLDAEPPPMRVLPAAAAAARPRRPVLAWVAGAAAAVLVGVLGVQVVDQGRRIDELQQAAAEDPARRAFELAKAEAGSRVVELTGDGVVLEAVLTSDGDGWLDASPLAELDRSRTYQLWGASGEVLVSLGVLGRAPQVVHFDARGTSLLAVTAERAPGVVVSEQPPVAAGAVTA